MALAPRLDLRQSQSLVMTPQMQQAIRLLAASNLELHAMLADALESNPLLEAESADLSDLPDGENGELAAKPAASGEGPAERGETEAATRGDSEVGDWAMPLTGSPSSMPADDEIASWDRLAATQPSLAQHLEAQIGAVCASEKEEFIARYLIGLLDEAGYLRFELGEIARDLGVARDDVEAALGRVQSLEPTGVGARTLAECLALQAREADRYDPCMARLIDNLELVARGDLARLRRLCDVDDEDLAEMLAELRSYDPRPGLAFGSSGSEAIVPDILLEENADGNWKLALNPASLPRLVINRAYQIELDAAGAAREAQDWLRQKLADASWLIRALDQRQKTILKTAAEIVRQQDGFFRHGVAHLRPLTLREVADAIEMHESTVSRVTSNKYLQCARGTFELRYFFSSSIASSNGEGASSQVVKARIKALINGEDARSILSDDKLVALLRKEGFDIARRTVAKYREALGIGSSVERRRARKLAQLR